MIWYLLYPFRGTTDPPALGSSHPLRRIFTRYGREASRHPVITLLISVTIAAILIYPFPFLYTNSFKNGTSNLPHHVWTTAQPYEGSSDISPDVVMRSIWIHGSYMKALDIDVLRTALDIQDELLGPTMNFDPAKSKNYPHKDHDTVSQIDQSWRDSFHAINGLSNQSWFFHSPLLYWSGSKEAILQDQDIISTVNHGSQHSTTVNVTLRHSVVFSGKRFEDNRLVAADALVVTLIHKLDSPVGRQWERRAEDLALSQSEKWQLFPHNGRARSSKLYEFRFQPLSLQDDILLGFAYGLTTLYFFASLTRLRAVKSRVGLTITVVAHITISIMSSFTICAILKVDLSKIPREAYPLVVLTIGLENIFRLINGVISTPPQNSMPYRIAEALGRTGHVALAGVGQNLFILWILHKVVSPGVGAFCIFAAIALIFDFIYLITFFVSVLSVDVRRTELSDSLASRRNSDTGSPVQQVSWADAILKGEVPVSTRVAGTVVMVGFILMAQWHFFDHKNVMRTLYRLVGLLKPEEELESISFKGLNQARTPTAWLRLQDHETAREVIQVIKPHAHSYIAQVYEPLVFVLNGSDRTPTGQGIRVFLPAAYDFLRHQSIPFLTTVLFIVAAVSLLMNFLLWDEDQQGNIGKDHDQSKDEPPLAAKSLPLGHVLDVAMLTCSSYGMVASVGLDRFVRVWDVKSGVRSHLIDRQYAPSNLFPIMSIAIDGSGHWLAIASANGRVSLWDIEGRRWGPSAQLDIKMRSPIAFFFEIIKASGIPPLILVHPNGLMSEMIFAWKEPTVINELQICRSPLVCAREFWDKASVTASQPLLHMITASRRGCVHVVTHLGGGWVSEGIETALLKGSEGVLAVQPLPALRCFLAVRVDAVDLISLEDYALLHTFEATGMVPTSLRCFHSSPKRATNSSGILESFSLIYKDFSTGSCKLDIYLPPSGLEGILVGGNGSSTELRCCDWSQTTVESHVVEQPGDWEVLPIGVVVGIRKHNAPEVVSGQYSQSSALISAPVLRRRLGASKLDSNPGFLDEWETWMLSSKGEMLTASLSDDQHQGTASQQLIATTCGPISKIGDRSIAVALGNNLKIITIGHERYDGGVEMAENLAAAIAGRRRKPLGGKRACSNIILPP